MEPNRGMSDDDARALTAFLMSQKGGEKAPHPAKAETRTQSTKEVAQR